MTVTITVSGILFDMDGTLVSSTEAVETALGHWAEKQGMLREEFFSVSHGVRTRDNVRKFQKLPVPGSELNEEELTATVDAIELEIANAGKALHEAGKGGIVKLPGVEKLLTALREGNAPWGIVTSATSAYADSALQTSEIVPPALPFRISGNQCEFGKPHPEPYLKGLELLKKLPGVGEIKAENVLVFEDAPSGLRAGLAAGCQTLAVCTGVPRAQIRAEPATYKVVDLDRVEVVKADPSGITLKLSLLEDEDDLSIA